VKPGGDDGWNVDGVAIHEESRRVVYSRNVDGYTEITVGELVEPDRIDPFPTPDLPEGVAGGVSFGPDGDRFAITAAGSAHNANVYVVDTTTGETERWTAASTAGIPPDTFVDPELVHYPTFDGRDPRVLPPATEPPEDGYPVVDIHPRRAGVAAPTLLRLGQAVPAEQRVRRVRAERPRVLGVR